MENLNGINKELESVENFDDLSDIAFNDLFMCFTQGDSQRILKMEGTTEIIKEMISFFIEKEEYEKCSEINLILKKLNIFLHY